MIKSVWSITFDPGGGDELSLAAVDDLLGEAPPVGATQEVETVGFIAGATKDHYPRGKREFGWTLTVKQYHATLIAAEQWRQSRLEAIPWDVTAPLEVACTALSLTRRMAGCVIRDVLIDIARGTPATVAKYVLIGKPFVTYAP